MNKEASYRFSWILFDADNTIFDFHASSEIAFHKSFRLHGMESSDEVYERFKYFNQLAWQAFDENNMSHDEIKAFRFSTLFEEIGIDRIDPLEFNALYFRMLVENIRYVEGALEILDYLRGKFKLAIITNGMKEVQRPRLEASEIYDFFKLIVVSGEIGHSKPNPSFFEFVHHSIDENEKENVLVVGDNLIADIKGGLDFGFRTAWYNPHKILNENGIIPDFEIDHLGQLKDIVTNSK